MDNTNLANFKLQEEQLSLEEALGRIFALSILSLNVRNSPSLSEMRS